MQLSVDGKGSLAKTREGGRGSQYSGSPDTGCTPPTPPNRQTPAGEEALTGNPYPLLLSQTDRVRAVQCLYHASVLLQASGKLRIHVCTHSCFIVLHTPPKAPRTLTATAGPPRAIRRPRQTTMMRGGELV